MLITSWLNIGRILIGKGKKLLVSRVSIFCTMFFKSLWVLKTPIIWLRVNSSPSDKLLDMSKLKTFADVKINVRENMKFLLGSVGNNVGKGENAGYQHFLHFPQCFQKALFSKSLKVGIVWYTNQPHAISRSKLPYDISVLKPSISYFNSFLTVNNTRSFSGHCRSRPDCKECAV